jgi:hypothetical protein
MIKLLKTWLKCESKSNATQATVHTIYQHLKAEWDTAVLDSGYSQTMFFTVNENNKAVELIHKFTQSKLDAESLGFTMPDLIPGLTITYSDQDKNA